MRWSNLTLLGKLIILTLLTMGIVALGQEPTKSIVPLPASLAAPKEMKPTEIQSLRLQIKQKDALLAKAALEQAQRAFQQALTDLTAEGEKVKLENGWAKDTQFDPNGLGFSAPPAKDAKKP